MPKRSGGLRLRGGIWYADVTVKARRVVRSSLSTNRQEAERFRDELRAELWSVVIAGKAAKISFEQAAGSYLNDRQGRLLDIETTRDRLRWICNEMGREDVSLIDAPRIRRLLDVRRAQGVVRMIKLRNGTTKRVVVSETVADATLDRYAAAISVVLNHAHERGIRATPAPKVEHLQQKKRRAPKFLSAEQAARLIENLPAHHVPMVLFALATGLRRSNVTGMEWDRVDLSRRMAFIPGDQAKSGDDILVPLNDDAIAVLRGQLGKHPRLCFPYRGQRVTRITGVYWRKAVEAAGLPPNTIFHHMRHTWASWHAMNNTPLQIIQKLGGWKNASMVEVYANLADEVVSSYAGNATPVSLVTNQQHRKEGTS